MTRRHRPRLALFSVFFAGLLAGWLLAASTLPQKIALWLQNLDAVVSPLADLARSSFGNAVYMGNLEARELEEVSGIAFSARRPDLLWALNDSGGGPVLYAVGRDGSDRGRVRVQGAENVDWEALARFVREDTPYLLIGDIGDNVAMRDHVSFYVVREPSLEDGALPPDASVPFAFRIDARYEDGPRDAEAIAIDPEGEQILILSKRSQPPVLYALPLEPTGENEIATAKRIASVDTLPASSARDLEEGGFLGRFRSQPTALRLADDGRSAIVLTYKQAYEFPRRSGDSWADAFARPPQKIPLPPLRQAEAAALEPQSGALWVTSEQHPAPLFRVPHQR